MDVARRVRHLRLERELTQKGLALRAGMSLSSLRRFERTGEIAFSSLIRIGFVLNAIDSFENLFPTPPRSLDALIPGSIRKRGCRE